MLDFCCCYKGRKYPCGNLPCVNIFALFFPSLFLFALFSAASLNIPLPSLPPPTSRLLSLCRQIPLTTSSPVCLFLLRSQFLTYIHSTMCLPVLGTFLSPVLRYTFILNTAALKINRLI